MKNYYFVAIATSIQESILAVDLQRVRLAIRYMIV